jgi:uncharacterized protein (DUF779 family)
VGTGGPRPGCRRRGPERTGRVPAHPGPEPGRGASWRAQTGAPPAQIGGSRLTATATALAKLAALRRRHGPLLLYQSGGCCDGSSPLCLPRGELLVGPGDLCLGELDGTPFYVDAEQYERWNRPRFLLDLAPGPSDGFTLEAADDVHFVSRTP